MRDGPHRETGRKLQCAAQRHAGIDHFIDLTETDRAAGTVRPFGEGGSPSLGEGSQVRAALDRRCVHSPGPGTYETDIGLYRLGPGKWRHRLCSLLGRNRPYRHRTWAAGWCATGPLGEEALAQVAKWWSEMEKFHGPVALRRHPEQREYVLGWREPTG